jgi:hypothetical protein
VANENLRELFKKTKFQGILLPSPKHYIIFMTPPAPVDGLESVLLVVLAAATVAVTVMAITGRLGAWSTEACSTIPLAEAYVVQNDGKGPRGKRSFKALADKYHTFEQVSAALRDAGLESSDLIVGVDFTKSNIWQGEKSFAGKCLHHLDERGGHTNPYQRSLRAIGRTLEEFDDDRRIPAFGFGDATTGDKGIFTLNEQGPCHGFREVLQSYQNTVKKVRLSGPTNFAPLINAAANIARTERSFHILVIIADGQVTSKQATVDAIVRASEDAPLSIVMVGVGDGPWDCMEEFDDALPQRRWDNFQFVAFGTSHCGASEEERDARFAMHALMEIPEQFQMIKAMGLLG